MRPAHLHQRIPSGKNLSTCLILPLILAIFGYYVGTFLEFPVNEFGETVEIRNYSGSILKKAPVVSIIRF